MEARRIAPPKFHLSIGVESIEDSVAFFTQALRAQVIHRDPSGYVNIDLFGSQITLKNNPTIAPDLPDFHFGVNLSLQEFNELSAHVLKNYGQYVAMKPEIWEAGTPMERKKMYLKCPTGYTIELKGYK
jgi:extradiol dioxygenase family protein